MKVIIDRRVLANFRKRAWRKYPKEHMEALFGYFEDETAYITIIYPFPHTATVWACHYDSDEIARLNVEALAFGLAYMGGIHSHTGLKTCEHPSKIDHIEGVEEGSSIEAILYLYKQEGRKNSRVNFYVPSDPIVVEYTTLE